MGLISPVKITGLREFNRALRQIDAQLPRCSAWP